MNKSLLTIVGLGNIRKNNMLVKSGILLIISALLMTGMVFASYSNDVNKGLADNLIRLHVVANSDLDEDQALKREVRDVILDFMKVELKDSRDIEQTKYIINNNISKIEDIAKETIARYSKNYSVKTMLGTYPFPTKLYGDITLPAGNYQALRVVIGKGEGANWWCVLFPPLCFVDATHGTVSESVKGDLKGVLSDEEYKIITSTSDDEDIPIKLKFKVVEIFQGAKVKVSGLINKIFKLI